MKRKKWMILVVFTGIAAAGITWRFIPTKITKEKAISISKSILTDAEKNTITNYDTPQLEVIVFDEEPFICKSDDTLMLANKTIYKITYNTKLDGLLGPNVIYVNAKKGVIYGRKFRL